MDQSILHLAERLVVAMETMSKDMKRLCVYVHDLRYPASSLQNDKREKEGISPAFCNGGDSLPHGTPAAGLESSVQSDYCMSPEQVDVCSLSHTGDLESEEISSGNIATSNVDDNGNSNILTSVTDSIKTEEHSESEESYESHDEPKVYSSGSYNMRDISDKVEDETVDGENWFRVQDENNVRNSVAHPVDKGVSEEMYQQPQIKCIAASSILQKAASSTQSCSVDVMGVNIQEHFVIIPHSSECRTQHGQGQNSFAAAPYITAGELVHAETADRHLAGQGDKEVGGVGWKADVDQTESEKASNSEIIFPENYMQEFALRSSSERCDTSRVFECPICQKQFLLRRLLMAHIRTHTRERPFKCHQCSKAFKQKVHLRAHMITHGGERKFKCSLCDKRFKRKGDLGIHMRCHFDERPFRCSLCGKAFRMRSHLTSHFRIHTGERPFKCGQCGKEFIARNGLNVHKQTHKAKGS